MIDIHPQYVMDKNKQCRAVLLPVEEWGKILEALEELDDIRAYDEARTGSQDAVPLEQAGGRFGKSTNHPSERVLVARFTAYGALFRKVTWCLPSNRSII